MCVILINNIRANTNQIHFLVRISMQKDCKSWLEHHIDEKAMDKVELLTDYPNAL